MGTVDLGWEEITTVGGRESLETREYICRREGSNDFSNGRAA